jgi:hypothetical protein
MRRETSRVSFLMCPFCVRGLVSSATTLLTEVAGLERNARGGPLDAALLSVAARLTQQRCAQAVNDEVAR